MSEHESEHLTERALQARLQYLLDLDISTELTPEQRLLLAVLRQAVLDYFDDDPLERLSAALYFARSPIYRATLRLFNLPATLLPEGVDLTAFRRKEAMVAANEPDPLRLETLVHQLSGTQLKVILTMGLLPLPATARAIALNSGLVRQTTLGALEQLTAQGLVRRHDDGPRPMWSFNDEVRRVLLEVWGGKKGEV